MNSVHKNEHECFAAFTYNIKDWRLTSDIQYYPPEIHESDEYLKSRCRLDVYYCLNPLAGQKRPVLVWFHGGGFWEGEKGIPELYKFMNCVIVAPSYRLTPNVKSPAFFEDGAAALAWTRSNIEKYGGDKNNIFVAGHSAGAYLAFILALKGCFLEKHGLCPNDFRGFISVSGQMVTHLTLRAEKNIPVEQLVVDEMAPIYLASKDAPPLLLTTGAGNLDFPCRAADNLLMAEAMKYKGHTKTEFYELPGLDHATIVDGSFIYIGNFIRKYFKC